MECRETTKEKEYLYHGKVITVRRDMAELADGSEALREVVEHPGGVGIALEDEDGTFFFVRQFRYAQQCVTLEYPAGKKEKGEDPLTTAKREIIEETGYEGLDFVYLGSMMPTPAYDTEVIEMYYARKGRFLGQHLDEDEAINVEKYTLEQMKDMILKGEVPDAKTIAMTFLVEEYKKRSVTPRLKPGA